jgi:hypothetical protein
MAWEAFEELDVIVQCNRRNGLGAASLPRRMEDV